MRSRSVQNLRLTCGEFLVMHTGFYLGVGVGGGTERNFTPNLHGIISY